MLGKVKEKLKMVYQIMMLEKELENTFLYELNGDVEKSGRWQIQIDVFGNEELLKEN